MSKKENSYLRYAKSVIKWGERDAERRLKKRQALGYTARKNAERSWHSGGNVDGQPARTRYNDGRTEALWGGTNARGDGGDKGHLVSNDDINADYVRDPGMDDHDDYVVGNRRPNPYR